MNILEHYNKESLKISEPYTIDNDTYFCKFSYNNMPFIIKTNRVCYLKKRNKNSHNYINISLTSQEYLIWFEQFYQECIQIFFEKSEDWFEDPLSLSDIEFSFINPLKSNIKDNCFDIQCITDDNRLHIIDSNENVRNLDDVSESKIIPTFHIKGVKFNNKHFILEIELNNLYIILDENVNKNEDNEKVVDEKVVDEKVVDEKVVNEREVINEKVDELKIVNEPQNLEENNDISEFNIPTDNLENLELNINKESFFKIYELINDKIKNGMVNHLRTIFIEKKIKNDINLSEMVNDDEEEDN
jgi:hypothetical protein